MADAALTLTLWNGEGVNGVVAVDQDGAKVWQYAKVAWGASGTQTPVSAAAPLPVDLGTNNDVTATLAAETTKVIGTINVSAAQTIAATNAGTFVVQEDGAALTALQLLDDAVFADSAVFTAGTDKLLAVGGAVLTGAPTYTTGDVAALSLDTAGALRVSGASGGAVTNAGTFVVQVDGAALTALQLIDDAIFADSAVYTPGTSKLIAAGGAVITAAPTYTTGDVGALSLDTSGRLRVIAGAGSAEIVDDTTTHTAGTTAAVNIALVAAPTDATVDANDLAMPAMTTSRAIHVSIENDSVGIGGGTQYTEDAVAAADPIGGAVIFVRDDTPVSIAADGDNVAQRGTQYGAGYVQVVDSSGNFIDTFGGSGGTAMADDGAFTAGTTQGTPAFAVWDDTTPVSIVTDGDAGVLRMSQNRNLYSTIRDAAGNERGVNVSAGNALLVDASATTQPVSGTVTANPASGTITTVSTVTNLSQMGGVAISLNTGVRDTGTQRVTIATDDTVAVSSGAFTELSAAINASRLDVTLNAETTKVIGTVRAASGGFASGSIASGAIVDLPLPSGAATSANQLAANIAVAGPSVATAIDSYTTAAINLTTGADQVIQAAPGASKQIWVYGFGFTCGDAAGQTVSIQDSADVAATGIMEFSQYGGISVPPSGNWEMPVLKLATNVALEVDITGGDVDGFITYAVVSV